MLLGRELEQLDDQELRQVVARCNIYARVAPEQKLRIVKALQASGEVVAMTGDGINDAPALKQAHIGVAMGRTGTDVSKEAADMVLLDDNFASIVNAVEEGRLVYANIRRFVKYILGSNVGELLTIGSAPLLGLVGVPLTPLQILWMNLVTDGLPALALALEPGDAQLMQRRPAQPGESIFARGLGRYILRIGVVFALIVISLMLLAERSGWPWPTMVFTTLCLAQMGHALSARSEQPLLQVPAFSNPWLLVAVALTSALQLLLLYVPPGTLLWHHPIEWAGATHLRGIQPVAAAVSRAREALRPRPPPLCSRLLILTLLQNPPGGYPPQPPRLLNSARGSAAGRRREGEGEQGQH